MPTDALPDHRQNQPLKFVLRGVAWSLGLFGLVRLTWFESHAVLPLTHLQTRFAEIGFGAPALPIDVTLACSGADALALCAGAILAYPAGWRVRLRGAFGGVALILALNAARIGTLGRAAGSPKWFNALHVYVWPALLTLAIAAYVLIWMRGVERRARVSEASASSGAIHHPSERQTTGVTRSFVLLIAAFLILFTAASPLYLESAGVLAVAAFIARAAASILRALGVQASAAGNVLSTARGQFLVTQECISTPLIPVYAAAVFAYCGTWRRRGVALLAAAPLFVGLGIARLLVVALPPALVASPLFLVHAFYQLLLAAVVVLLAAVWRHGAGPTAWRRALIGGALGAALVYAVGTPYTHLLTSAVAAGAPFDDPQGAIALLPAFQAGLYVALSVAVFDIARWRFLAAGLVLLGLSQIGVFAALPFAATHPGLMPHVRDVRAWALAGPLLALVAMVTYERPPR